jgi:hypothetical protein
VMLAVRNSIPSFRRLDLESAAEIVACELRPSGKKKVLFVVFYRPPSSDLSYLKEAVKSVLRIFLCITFCLRFESIYNRSNMTYMH